MVSTFGGDHGSCRVDVECESCLIAVEVLKGERINAILGEFVATLIVYGVAVLGKHDDSFIRPLELNRAVGVTVVVHTDESSFGVSLNIVKLCGYGINAGSEFVGYGYLVDCARSEGVRKSFGGYYRVVIVLINLYPSVTAIGGLEDDNGLNVAFVINTLGDYDVELLFFCILGYADLGCIKRDHEVEGFGFAVVVYCYHGVSSACGECVGFADAEVADELIALVVYREHCHFVEAVGDGNGYFLLEVVGAVVNNRVDATFAYCVEDFGSFADNREVVVTGIAPLIAYCEKSLALDLVKVADEFLAVDENCDVIAEGYRACEDVLAVGVGVEVFTFTCGCRLFLPIEEVLDVDLCILCDYCIEAFLGEVCHKLVGVAGFLIDEILTVYSVSCIDCIHCDACIPRVGVPSACGYKALFSCGCKCECVLIGAECEEVAVHVECLVVFLLQGIGENVFLGGGEFGSPNVACMVDDNHLVQARVDGVNGFALGVGLAVNGYSLDGRVKLRIAVRPSDHHVAVGVAVGQIGDVNRLDGAVDYYGVVACGYRAFGESVEGVFTFLVELCTGHILNEGIAVRKLYKALCRIALELDVCAVGVSTVADLVTVNKELCGRHVTVDGDLIGCGNVGGCIVGVETIETFCGELRSRSVGHIGACAGLHHVGSTECDVIGRHILDIGCACYRTAAYHGTACIKRTCRLGRIECNAYGRGAVSTLIYGVEIVRSLSCELCSRCVCGVVGRTGHSHVAVCNSRIGVACNILNVGCVGVASA